MRASSWVHPRYPNDERQAILTLWLAAIAALVCSGLLVAIIR